MSSSSANSFSETETIVIGILRDVLKKESIELDDDFLLIGGDSLDAMTCISRIRERFGVELSVEDFLFDEVTASRLAAKIESEKLLSRNG